MDASPGGLRLAPHELASDDGPLCVLSQLPLGVYFALVSDPMAAGTDNMGFHSGVPVCVSTVFHDTPSSAQAKGLQEGGHHSDSSVLAAEGVVSGSSGTAPETTSSYAGEVGSPAAASCSQVPSAIAHASAS